MTLVCVRAFGNFKPGDTVEVPKDAQFDTTYFAVKADKTGKGEK